MLVRNGWLTSLDQLRRTERFPTEKSARQYVRDNLDELIAALVEERARGSD